MAGRHEYSIIPDSEGYTLTDDENRGSSYVGIYPTIGKAVRVARKLSSQKGEGAPLVVNPLREARRLAEQKVKGEG